jgi:hypothetical protein
VNATPPFIGHQLPELTVGHLFPHAQRDPDPVRPGQGKRPFESRWRDANHGEGQTVQCQRLAWQRRIRAKLVRPQAVADHDHRVGARLPVFFGQEQAAAERLDAQHVEIGRARHASFVAGENTIDANSITRRPFRCIKSNG